MSGFVSEPAGTVLAEGGGARVGALVPSAASNGTLFAFHYVAPAGFPGPPLQRRSDADQMFYVVEGTLTLQVDGAQHELRPGQSGLVPRGAAFGFANATASPVVFVGVLTPAGRLEEMLAEIGRHAAGNDGPPQPERIAEIHVRFGAEVLGPPILEHR